MVLRRRSSRVAERDRARCAQQPRGAGMLRRRLRQVSRRRRSRNPRTQGTKGQVAIVRAVRRSSNVAFKTYIAAAERQQTSSTQVTGRKTTRRMR